MVTVANKAAPAPSPSTPSIKLKAFEQPASHSSVPGRLSQVGTAKPATLVICTPAQKTM
jgi:hypothetical protein